MDMSALHDTEGAGGWVSRAESDMTRLGLKMFMKVIVIALELRDRVVGSGPAQQAMLREASDPASRLQPFELNLFKKIVLH